MLLSDYDWKEIELLEHLRSMLPHKVLQLSRENCRRFIERFSEREKNSNQLKMGGGVICHPHPTTPVANHLFLRPLEIG